MHYNRLDYWSVGRFIDHDIIVTIIDRGAPLIFDTMLRDSSVFKI